MLSSGGPGPKGFRAIATTERIAALIAWMLVVRGADLVKDDAIVRL
jgi:hypothetical protein